MCGIFGHTADHAGDLEASRRALHTLEHRGPDAWGDWRDDRVYLGHRRLSIIDLSDNARQPMAGPGGAVVITVNGEIYNFRELRNILQEAGHTFNSESDSEVILHGYEEWGAAGLVQRLEGMFALAIYDQLRRSIFLFRDRVGIKPLYYSLLDGELAWASELKALQVHHGDRLHTDRTALYDFLTYSFIPTPKTCFDDVFKLPPAHYAEFDLDRCSLSLHCYWRLSTAEEQRNVAEAAEQFRALLDKSVAEQLVSDVPLGFFLSGGLDSSAIVAAASGVAESVNTFSIGFDDPSHDETGYAQEVADLFRTNHTREILTVDAATGLLERLSDWYDEPFGDTSALPTYLVSRFARGASTVALSGDGGDELFGGYRFYNRFGRGERPVKLGPGWLKPPVLRLRRRLGSTPARKVCNRIVRRLSDEIEHHVFIKGGLLREEKTGYRKRWDIGEGYDDYWYLRKFWRPDLPIKTRLQYLDFHTSLHDDMLTKVDRASMAVGLETRVPLLSTELVEFAFSLPESVRYHGRTLKGLVKYAFRDVFPDRFIHRKKKGFSIPAWGGEFSGREQPRQLKILELFGFA